MQENLILRSRPIVNSSNQCRRGQAGNVLWLSADQLVYKDNGTTLASNNDKVRLWGNRDIYGCSAWNTNTSAQPTYLTNQINGLPVVSFDSTSSQYLVVNNQSNFNVQSPTIFLVASGSTGSFMGKGDTNHTDARHRKLQVRVNSSSQVNYWSGTDSQSANAATATMANFNIFCIIPLKTNNVYYNINGVETLNTFGIDIQTMNSNSLVLGAGFDTGAEFGTVKIAEVLIYNRVLPKYQMHEEISRLATKYAITVSNIYAPTIAARVSAGSRVAV